MGFRRRRRALPRRVGAADAAAGDAEADGSAASFDARAPGYRAAFARFLRQSYAPELRQLRASLAAAAATPLAARRDPQGQQNQQSFAYSLRICAQRLLDASPSLASLLFRHPDQLLPLFHAALADEVASASGEKQGGLADVSAAVSVPLRARQKLKVRVEHLPPVGGLRKPGISAVRSNDVKQLIQIAGTVVRTGMIKMQETSREYQCASARCGYRFLVKSDPEQGNVLEIPKVCPSETGGKPCRSTQFDIVNGSQVVSDHQVIKIQEQASKLGVGSIPRSILVVLEDDLVDSVKAGDQVVVVGILMRCWQPVFKGVRCDLETIVKANSIRIKNATSAQVLVTEELKNEFAQFWKFHEADPMRGRNEIIASICPKVYGLFIVKLGVALTVIGGCSHVDESGMKTRGEPHMLLIGDPGTGKSQFLRFTAELSPRSVLTTGIGTTSAGLTCTAVKDGSEWMLEAGALVLADRGICCIDEFSSIRSNDRTSIHEAMEQQTLSVAKAGLVCKLNARTTIFAVTNPKGRYDPNADVSVNTSIASPLLSRFDLILVLLDRMSPSWDQVVSSFILKQSTAPKEDDGAFESTKDEDEDHTSPSFNLLGSQNRSQATVSHSQRSTSGPSMPGKMADDLLWSIPKLQAYICYVKEKYQPQLTHEAMLILQRYYQMQRASDDRSAARTTIRLLESLTRLSQAHARLMWHEDVRVTDAVVAVFIMEVSKATDGYSQLLGGGLESVLHSDFAEDPASEYALQEKLVLEYLGLSELRTVSSRSSQSQKFTQSPPSWRSRSRYEHREEAEAHVPASEETNRPWAQRFGNNSNVGVKRWSQREDLSQQERPSQRPRQGAWASGYVAPPPSQKQTWSQRSVPVMAESQVDLDEDDEDEDVDYTGGNDDYYRNRHQAWEDAVLNDGSQQQQQQQQQSQASPIAGSRPRFDFGKWSQQAEAHQSITSRWRSQG